MISSHEEADTRTLTFASTRSWTNLVKRSSTDSSSPAWGTGDQVPVGVGNQALPAKFGNYPKTPLLLYMPEESKYCSS